MFSPPGLTGDWGGSRTWLSDRGVEFSIDFTNSVQSVMSGGLDETTQYLGPSEMFYTFQLMPHIALTFDLQYIDTGLGNGLIVTGTPDDPWVGGIRLRFVL